MWRKLGRATASSISWFVVTCVSYWVGVLVAAALTDLLWRLRIIPRVDIMLLEAFVDPAFQLVAVGAIIGSLSGIGQGVILRRLGGSIRVWAGLSIVGWVLGLTLEFRRWLPGNGALESLFGAVLLGASQWIYLSRRQDSSGVWSVGTVIGILPAFWANYTNSGVAEVTNEWRMYLDAGLWWATLSSFFLLLYLIWWPSDVGVRDDEMA